MSKKTLREALNDAIREEMERDPSVFILGEEVAQYNGAYKVTKGLLEQFGAERVVDTPISENGFAGMGLGAALGGLRPIVEMMTWNFAVQAFDQILNHIAKMKYMSGGQFSVPLVIRGPNGAAQQLAAQHSQCFEHMLSHFPGVAVVSTSEPADAKGLLKTAIRSDFPVLFLESEFAYSFEGDVSDDPNTLIPLGKGVVVQEGTDLTIVTWNKQRRKVCEWVKKLESERNLSCTVIDPRTIQPLDFDLIAKSVRQTHRLLIVEEGWGVSSVGCTIVDYIVKHCFDDLDAPPERVHNLFAPMPYNKKLEEEVLPTERRFVEAIERLMA
jgi:pyruvate dehydrogenase E1 component beta subunit